MTRRDILIHSVREYAWDLRNEGWGPVIAWEDEEVEQAVGDARCLAQAVRRIAPILEEMHNG